MSTLTKRLSDEQVDKLLRAAAERVGLRKWFEDLPANFQQARAEFKEHLDPNLNIEQLANEAMFGVLAVYVAGGHRTTILGDPTPRTNFPDWNMYHGMAPIDDQNRIDFTDGDPYGADFHQVEVLLRNGRLSPNAIIYLEKNGFDVDGNHQQIRPKPPEPAQPTYVPRPEPYGK